MDDESPIWHALSLAPTRDVVAIRRAYAAKLRATRPEEDPEAFQALRAAYEAALTMASRPRCDAGMSSAPQSYPDPAGSAADSAPAGLASEPPDAPLQAHARAESARCRHRGARVSSISRHARIARDEGVDELRQAYTSFQQLLSRDEAIAKEDLIAAAESVVEALQHTDIELAAACELALAHTLVNARSRGDVVISMFAARLGWWARAADWRADPVFASVLRRATASEFLERLQRQPTAAARALRFLREPCPSWKLRLALATDAALEQTMAQLLHYIHTACPDALLLLDRSAVMWWNAHFERACARPHALDWLWLGATLLLPIFASLAPASSYIDGVILSAVALTVLWAIWSRKPSRLAPGQSRLLRPALSVVINLPLGSWWLLVLTDSQGSTDGRVACAVAGALFSHALATRRLIEWWVLKLVPSTRRWTQGCMAIAAFMVLAAAVGTDQTALLTVLASIITAIVLVHRLPASQLIAAETRVRIYVTAATWMALALLLALSKLDDPAALRTGAVLFAAGVLITLAVCLAGEIREADALRLRNRASS